MNILLFGSGQGYIYDRLRQSAKEKGYFVDIKSGKDISIVVKNDAFQLYIGKNNIEFYDIVYPLVYGDIQKDIVKQALYFYAEKNKIKFINLPKNPCMFVPFLNNLLHSCCKGEFKIPKTVIISSFDQFDSYASEFNFPIICRTMNSKQGLGVFLIKDLNGLKSFFDQKDQRNFVILREFIPNEGDYRILSIGHKVVHGYKRKAKQGEFRNNSSRGGTVLELDLSKTKCNKIFDSVERLSKKIGLEVAGFDIMIHNDTGEAYILEVNTAPSIVYHEKNFNMDIVDKILEYFETSIRNTRG